MSPAVSSGAGRAIWQRMITQILWSFRQFARRLWVRAALLSALAVVVAGVAPLVPVLPLPGGLSVSAEALDALLSILTNSMLTVTTFSLSIMVSAHLAADANATPRAHRLLQEDSRTQTVIATFIGAFIYALALTVLLNIEFINARDVPFIYIVSVGVIIFVVIAVLRWVAHLAGLGSVEATIDRVEERARACLKARSDAPFLGARDIRKTAIPQHAPAFHAERFGFIQNIDVSALDHVARDRGAAVYLSVGPGDWIDEGAPLGLIDLDTLDQATATALSAAVVIGDRRTPDEDANQGLIVLSEIAMRALSPGINDPRTAIDVIGRLAKLMATHPQEAEMEEPSAPHVFVHPMDRGTALLATLDPIARDGRTFVEVQLSVQRAYATLTKHRDASVSDAAMALSARALSYARDGILMIEDMHRIAAVAPARHMAATSAGDAKESVVEALGEERNSSHFADI
ncbi:Uncharacterized membrane protein [Palleronia salina]|uniref:Uncharacterized membrane protein n=2 Tax=Palleronia salina TaxID=313368 RepID=A0A1M6JU07_9RHOB|nr:Uncharacterized membrane protein [Palleronia salina]